MAQRIRQWNEYTNARDAIFPEINAVLAFYIKQERAQLKADAEGGQHQPRSDHHGLLLVIAEAVEDLRQRRPVDVDLWKRLAQEVGDGS